MECFPPRDKLCLPFGKAFPAQRGASLVQAAPASRSGFCPVICFAKPRYPISSSTELVPPKSKGYVFNKRVSWIFLDFFFF